METLVNFRDIGGYKTNEGRKVKKKRLLRSAEVVSLSSKDHNRLLSDYQLKTIIDLRGQDEIKEKPDDEIKDVEYCNIDVMKELKKRTASKAGMMTLLERRDPEEHMMSIYKEFVLNRGAQESYRQFVKELNTKEEGSTLFHCFAGKDRTGMAAVIILKILGVHQDDIFEDYLLTNVQREQANSVLLKEAEKNGLTLSQLEALEVAMSVRASYLHYALSIIDNEFGNFFGYLEKGLQLNEQDFSTLKELYLEND